MLSVKAMNDGKVIRLLEKVEKVKPGLIVVTFLDEEDIDIKYECKLLCFRAFINEYFRQFEKRCS